MFINKTENGMNNACGRNVFRFRSELNISQRELADRLQLIGLDVDKNAIQRIEAGKRFVTDIEIIALAKVFVNVPFRDVHFLAAFLHISHQNIPKDVRPPLASTKTERFR